MAGLGAEKTPEGTCEVNARGVEEVVADKAYHSNDVACVAVMSQDEPPCGVRLKQRETASMLRTSA